jgi:transcriptional regulator with XRE-family HTH domain
MSKSKAKAEDFSKRFNELLAERGWDSLPDIELSKKLRRSNTTVWNWKNGIKLPSLDTAIDLAIFFDVCVDWLLTGRGDKHPGASSGSSDENDVLILSRLADSDKGHLKALFHSLADANNKSGKSSNGD